MVQIHKAEHTRGKSWTLTTDKDDKHTAYSSASMVSIMSVSEIGAPSYFVSITAHSNHPVSFPAFNNASNSVRLY